MNSPLSLQVHFPAPPDDMDELWRVRLFSVMPTVGSHVDLYNRTYVVADIIFVEVTVFDPPVARPGLPVKVLEPRIILKTSVTDGAAGTLLGSLRDRIAQNR